MGKVLRKFINGYPGAISRAVDDVVVSLKNASGGPIPFGAPVFLVAGDRAYELARRGEDVRLAAKPVRIDEIELTAFHRR